VGPSEDGRGGCFSVMGRMVQHLLRKDAAGSLLWLHAQPLSEDLQELGPLFPTDASQVKRPLRWAGRVIARVMETTARDPFFVPLWWEFDSLEDLASFLRSDL